MLLAPLSQDNKLGFPVWDPRVSTLKKLPTIKTILHVNNVMSKPLFIEDVLLFRKPLWSGYIKQQISASFFMSKF